jgi:uncharacterized Fe-S cluster protein YjdI
VSAQDTTRGRDPARTYANESIKVRWEPRLCIHTQNCVRGLPEVFDSKSRPWVRVDGADAQRVADAVLTCPTGALHFRRLDGGPQEEPQAETSIEPQRNGPLFVRGRILIVGEDGLPRPGGHTSCPVPVRRLRKKPFCDSTVARSDSGARSRVEGVLLRRSPIASNAVAL